MMGYDTDYLIVFRLENSNMTLLGGCKCDGQANSRLKLLMGLNPILLNCFTVLYSLQMSFFGRHILAALPTHVRQAAAPDN